VHAQSASISINSCRADHDGANKTTSSADASRGGATVLKVGGGQFCERREPKKKFFDPPLFGQWGGGQNIA